jgi:tetratricopeptide (TPR) repeat protein
LSILPFEVVGGTGLQDGLLNHVGEQIQNNSDIRKKWLVFSPGDARQNGVTTVDRAVRVFGATHALTGTITVDTGSVTVAGQLLEAGTALPVRTFTKTCPLDNEVCLQDGLVREIAGVLDPQIALPPQPAPIAKAAFPYYLQGMEYLRRDSVSYALAIDFFRQAIARDPSAILPRVALADGYMLQFRDTGDKTQLAAARGVLQNVLATHPDLPELHASFGNLHRMEGRYDAAARELQLAVQADPSNHVFHRLLADVYDAAQRDDEAAAAFEKVIALQPRYWLGYHNYAVFHYRRGHYDEAARLLETLVQWTPDHAQALATLGGVYTAMRRNVEAEQVSRRSCDLVPRRTCYVNLAVALRRQRRTTEAIAAYEQALSFGTPSAILLLDVAEAYAYLGRRDEALPYYRRAVARAEEALVVNLQNSGQRAILAYCLAEIGDRRRALVEMEQALQHSPKDRDVLKYGVFTYESLGERERTLEILRSAPLPLLEEIEAASGTEDLRGDPRYQAIARDIRNR